MTNEGIEQLVSELSGLVLTRLKDNAKKDTIRKRDVVGSLGHVNKTIFRLLQRDGTRDSDMAECVDAIAYLALVYAIRKSPYGEY